METKTMQMGICVAGVKGIGVKDRELLVGLC